MHFYKHLIVALILLCSFSFAQEKSLNGSIPVAKTPVDSVAYYDSLANYNYQRFRANETMSEVFYWTSIGLSVATPIVVFAARGAADCYGPEGCQDGNVILDVAAFTAAILFLPSWIAYGGFSIAKNRRQRNFNNYNRKKEDCLERRKLNDAESANLQVQVLPLLNPLDGRYGAALALSF